MLYHGGRVSVMDTRELAPEDDQHLEDVRWMYPQWTVMWDDSAALWKASHTRHPLVAEVSLWRLQHRIHRIHVSAVLGRAIEWRSSVSDCTTLDHTWQRTGVGNQEMCTSCGMTRYDQH